MHGGTVAPAFALCVLLAAACGAADVKDPLARRVVRDDGRITIADHGCREWGPELVHYRVDTERFRPGRLVLLDARGAAVPFQIDGDTLAFVASVPKGRSAVYRLTFCPSDRSKENTTLVCRRRGKDFEVRNEHVALRMPPPGTRAFDPPAPAAEATPPILQWACRQTGWMGRARFASTRRVASQRFSLLRRGPACVEYEARYRFAAAGEYVWRVRLSPGMPIAVVTEEFDFGSVRDGEDLLLLDVHAGWRARHVGWVDGAGEERMPPLRPATLEAFVRRKRTARAEELPVGGSGRAPSPRPPEEGLLLLEKNVPAGKWGGYKGGVQLWDGEIARPGTGRTIALVPLFAGSWRRAMALNAWHKPGTGVMIGLPISVRPMRWSLDIADDFSPFSTHEHDEGLSRTYGRRVWGLYVGTEMATAQARFGYIGLDRYKDWIVDCPERPGAARAPAWPGGFFSPAHVERIRRTLDRHPDGEFLKSWYLFSGRSRDAVRHARFVIEKLKKPYGENNFFLVGLSGYRKSQFLTFVHRAEDALACPALPAEVRGELRRWLALYAHVLSEPDLNPRGSGVHLGNNNMTINRTLALTYFAGLLPDHPRCAYWLDRARRYARFKFATQTAPDGVWVACPSYQTYSPLRTLNITQNVLRNRGIVDFSEQGYHAATLRYLANLTMGDPRFGGRRILPGMGNSSNLPENVWGFSMAAVADRDPKLAGFLRSMNRLANPEHQSFEKGPNYHDKDTPHAMYYLPDVPRRPTPLRTTFLPAYGVVFRAHFSGPGETALLFRAGMNWSHWDTDALNVILYGRGAPLSPGTGYQYYSGPAAADSALYHNQVKVGRRDLQEVFGRVDGCVADYGFGEETDYAVADRYYPPELFRDGAGEMHWRRHVLFLKSRRADGPSFFVLRDTFPGGEQRRTWWTWLNLGTADRIAVDGRTFDPNAAPLNKVVPEADFPRRRGRVVEMQSGFRASTWMWFARPREVAVRMTFDCPAHGGRETKTILEVPAAAGEDYLYVVYPRADGEPAPTCERLGDGVLRIATAEATDTVFLGDEPFDWSRDGVVFTGRAGAVRVFRDRVALCMNAGSGRIGYKGHVLEGHGPFQRVVKRADLRPGTHPIAGGYEKRRLSVDLGKGVAVTGEGPFDAKLDGETIRISASGRDRVIHVTQPPFIVRPQYWVDGQEWMACWTDYPASGWGSYRNTRLIGLSVPAGTHELVVKDMTFPTGWTRPFEPAIRGATMELRRAGE